MKICNGENRWALLIWLFLTAVIRHKRCMSVFLCAFVPERVFASPFLCFSERNGDTICFHSWTTHTTTKALCSDFSLIYIWLNWAGNAIKASQHCNLKMKTATQRSFKWSFINFHEFKIFFCCFVVLYYSRPGITPFLYDLVWHHWLGYSLNSFNISMSHLLFTDLAVTPFGWVDQTYLE